MRRAVRAGVAAVAIAVVWFSAATAPPAMADASKCVKDAQCSDGHFCNGEETCGPGKPGANAIGCVASRSPCAANTHCDEGNRRCIPIVPCTADLDCYDGVFCNGIERCSPGTAGADLRGCMPAPVRSPCGPNQRCDEHLARCEMICPHPPDEDGDGHHSLDCGGDDCDDKDANRYPGRAEQCDAAGHDEDCDPQTFGVRDVDNDGEPDAHCCNTERDGRTRHCGWDCDDNNGAIRRWSQICQPDGTVLVCNARGTLDKASCGGGNVCVPQPNGTGVCQRH